MYLRRLNELPLKFRVVVDRKNISIFIKNIPQNSNSNKNLKIVVRSMTLNCISNATLKFNLKIAKK